MSIMYDIREHILSFNRRPPPPTPGAGADLPGVTTVCEPLLCPLHGCLSYSAKARIGDRTIIFSIVPDGQGAAISLLECLRLVKLALC